MSPAARAALDPRVHDRTTGLVSYQRGPYSRVTVRAAVLVGSIIATVQALTTA